MTGGVGNFLRLLCEIAPPSLNLEIFVNGRRSGERTYLDKIVRLVGDYFRFALELINGSRRLVHFNPSLDCRSFPREIMFMLMAALWGRPFIVFFRGWDWEAYEKYLLGRGYIAYLCRFVLRKSCHIIVLSEDFKVALGRVFLNLPVTILTTMFDGRLIEFDTEKHYNKICILFMSRFLPAKRGDQVLVAFERFAKDYSDAKLIMAGDGPDIERLYEICEAMEIGADRVEFTGYVEGAEKAALLARSNVFVLPTEHPEGLPNALLEAMGAGIIPLVTQAGGTFEAIDNGTYGICLPNSSAEHIIAGLYSIVNDPAASQAWSSKIKTYAWSRFEASIVCKKIYSLYSHFNSETVSELDRN